MNGAPYKPVLHLSRQPKKGRCGGTLVTCQHVLTARHCVTTPDSEISTAYGYEHSEILSPENIKIGLGSTTWIGGRLADDRMIFSVQQIRAAESKNPDLAVLVLRDAINPTWPGLRPAMIFKEDFLYTMSANHTFLAIGWGKFNKTTLCK